MNIKIILSALFLSLMGSAFGQNNTAIDSLELVILTANEDPVKVNCLISLCKQYRNISDFEYAMQYAESTLAMDDRLKYKKGKADVYNAIGIVYDY